MTNLYDFDVDLIGKNYDESYSFLTNKALEMVRKY